MFQFTWELYSLHQYEAQLAESKKLFLAAVPGMEKVLMAPRVCC